jgi:Mg-chelatase subunit ChlD
MIGGLLPITQEGVDIVITLDISGSMRAEDMQPNRAAAAKEVAERFISGRTSDRIGLVAYAGEAYTQCPLTPDHNMLVDILKTLMSAQSRLTAQQLGWLWQKQVHGSRTHTPKARS